MKSAVVQQDLSIVHEEPATEKLANEKLSGEDVRNAIGYPQGLELSLIVFSLASAVFLVALVRT